MIRILICLVALVASPGFFTGTAQAAVTSLSGSVRDVPFFTEITRDPELVKQKILDEMTAETTLDRWQQKRAQLPKAKGKARASLLNDMLNDSVLLVYYLEDLALGRISESSKTFKITLKQARSNLAKYGRMLANDKNASASSRARGLFFGNVADYMNGNSQNARIKELAEVKGLNGYLSRRRDFMVSFHDLRRGNKAQSDKAVQQMAAMLPSFPLLASVSVRLIIGRYYAGVSTSGSSFTAADKAYRKFLWSAADRVSKLPELEQNQVLQFIAIVWTKAEGRGIDWSNPPYRMKSFPSNPTTLAIVERSAAQDQSKGKFAAAITKYDLLASSYEGTEKTKHFDDRILAVRAIEYKKTKDSRKFEKTLHDKIAKYSGAGALGEKGNADAVKTQYEQKLQALADAEIRAAKKKSAPVVQRRQAVSMAQRIFDKSDDMATKEKYAVEMGSIHQIHGEHEKAVAQFMDMALNGRPESKAKFYRLAIQSQNHLAKWPTQAPWMGFGKGPGAERFELAKMYTELNALQKNDWNIVGHLGLLHIATGEKGKAIELWTSAIDSLPVAKPSGYAAGFLLAEHSDNNNWPALESVARLTLKKNITPSFMKKIMNAHEYLALALLEGGKALLAAEKAKEAAKKLGEFTNTYKKHKRHDDGFYHYAMALYKSDEHMKGIEKIQEFVEAYPRSKFHKPALYNGGKWSLATASEEKVLYFFQEYVLKYNDSEKAQEVRLDLLALYEGKLLYRQVSQVYLRMTQDKNLDAETKKFADMERLQIEMQHNSPEAAVALAKSLEQKYPDDSDLKMMVYGTQAIAAAAKGNIKETTRLEKLMTALPSPSRDGQEMLGWVRYLRASMLAKAIEEEVIAISMKDPLGEMEKKYKTFLASKQQFDSVCDGIQTSHCAGAMFDLAQMSESSVKTFEDFVIADTLDKKQVDAFNNRKAEIIKSMTQVSLNANAKSIELAGSGESQPAHVRQILWFNSADWNFEGSDTENGHGFVQWKTAE